MCVPDLPSHNDLNLFTVLFWDFRFNLFLGLPVLDVQDHRASPRSDYHLRVSTKLRQKLLERGI